MYELQQVGRRATKAVSVKRKNTSQTKASDDAVARQPPVGDIADLLAEVSRGNLVTNNS